ncbi:hypothetical protein KCP73_10975 [Salmonella enterica subsp. enterica]|nr:hypothetical protein KCP73_10975 [Salmonella enterica subsp. enterica]
MRGAAVLIATRALRNQPQSYKAAQARESPAVKKLKYLIVGTECWRITGDKGGAPVREHTVRDQHMLRGWALPARLRSGRIDIFCHCVA